MNKSKYMLVVIFIIILLFSCNNIDEPINDNVIRILKPYTYSDITESTVNYLHEVAQKNGYEIEILELDASDFERYLLKRNVELFKENSIDLILSLDLSEKNKFVENDMIIEVKEHLSNFKNIESFARDEYSVTISIVTGILGLKKDYLELIDEIVPDSNWTRDDYYRIVEKYENRIGKIFTAYDYSKLYAKYFYNYQFIKNGEISVVDDQEFLLKIHLMREAILDGYYILDPTYDYGNYNNMLRVRGSKENILSEENERAFQQKNILTSWSKARFLKNPLSPLLSKTIFMDNSIVLPSVLDNNYLTPNLVVNKKSKKQKLVFQFLDDLISDEMQLILFKKEFDYLAPSVSSIEDEIHEISKSKFVTDEGIYFREYTLNKLRNESMNSPLKTQYELECYWKFLDSTLFEVIFSDRTLSEDEIRLLLLKFENEMNIYILE